MRLFLAILFTLVVCGIWGAVFPGTSDWWWKETDLKRRGIVVVLFIGIDGAAAVAKLTSRRLTRWMEKDHP